MTSAAYTAACPADGERPRSDAHTSVYGHTSYSTRRLTAPDSLRRPINE